MLDIAFFILSDIRAGIERDAKMCIIAQDFLGNLNGDNVPSEQVSSPKYLSRQSFNLLSTILFLSAGGFWAKNTKSKKEQGRGQAIT